MEKGFDFLGQNVRKYPNGKLLIKPSKKNIKALLDGFRGNLKAALGMSAADLINWFNPKIRGWPNYHRHVVSSRVFCDRNIGLVGKDVISALGFAAGDKAFP